ncbi:unnamed protein product [Blepharisma stoltei]|uniref:Uncharacterized protein n=1 Tax=Blepharisma stoltei TaxID=1481888 RepID=A0AAU9JQW1_9CILI|nr:unnamed protein product [Blepharisma stoltei]
MTILLKTLKCIFFAAFSSYLISGAIDTFCITLNVTWASVFVADISCALFFQELRDLSKLYLTAWVKFVSKSLIVFEWSINSSWVVGLFKISNAGLFLGADLTLTAFVFLFAIAVVFLWWLIFHLLITFCRFPLKILANLTTLFFIISFWSWVSSFISSIIAIGFANTFSLYFS